jgi:hypothetical protein
LYQKLKDLKEAKFIQASKAKYKDLKTKLQSEMEEIQNDIRVIEDTDSIMKGSS